MVVIGGDVGMPGAVKIAATAALKMGAGLVTVITRPIHVTAIVSTQPELLCYGLEATETHTLKSILEKATIIVLGPGLGQTAWSEALFQSTLNAVNQAKIPCLIDADGLNWLAKKTIKLHAHCIFTPHPAEAARLLKTTTKAIQSNREESAMRLQEKLGGVVVLKGAGSLVIDAKNHYQCNKGNPSMATGGMGDLLSGIIAGLATQGFNLFEASQFGVLLHATAGDIALKKNGGPSVLASELLPELKPLLRK